MFALAQERAQAEARVWSDERLRQIEGLSTSSEAFPDFFSALIDDWVRDQRRLAFAWREGQLLRSEGPAGPDSRAGWRRLWENFWRQALIPFGLEHGAGVVECLFENESFMHMLSWRRAIDRAGLDEMARGLGAWLAGKPMPASPWRDFARSETAGLSRQPAVHDLTLTKIGEAAAAIVGREGTAGVTHRAVAEHAGLTLGAVSYKVPTKSELLHIAFECLYSTGSSQLRVHLEPLTRDSDRQATLKGLADFLSASVGNRGGDALLLAIAHQSSLSQFGPQLRYQRGGTSRGLLQELLGGRREIGWLEGALFSGFLTSLQRRHFDDGAHAARAPMRLAIERLVAMV